MKSQAMKRVVLIGLLVLPVFIYIVFVYSQRGVFFKTLDIVGPKTIVQNDNGGYDTSYYQVPEFAFINQHNQTITQDSLKGNFYVASFFFTSCPKICPAMNFHLKQISDRFKAYDDFYIVSFSVDPERDTLEALQKYARDLGVENRNWHFLRGTEEEAHLLAPKYFMAANKDSAAEGGYNHTANVMLVDWNGNLRSRRDDNGNVIGSYDVMSVTELNKLEEDIKVLKAEYESWKHYQKKISE